MGVPNEVFSTKIGITETDNVEEDVEWREKERGAYDGV